MVICDGEKGLVCGIRKWLRKVSWERWEVELVRNMFRRIGKKN